MNYFNINNPNEKVSIKSAVLKSISSQPGLFMPESIPKLPKTFFENLHHLSLIETAQVVSHEMFKGDIPKNELEKIITNALAFSIPLKKLDENLHVQELFHGPTLAFKDVGARFMAGLFEFFKKDENQETTILVATSGDTGSAVANAFYNKKGIRVVILYPSGKVSDIQEKQLTTMGGNITSLEIKGNFDDCQKIVKQVFADKELNSQLQLTSANSINFARLFPQSFYYFHAISQLGKHHKPAIFSVPSGNFGNLTAGLIAKKMGLPVHKFIASNNRNCPVVDYLETERFSPKETYYTISNAMDVGNPSNFPRMLHLYNLQFSELKKDLTGYWFSDDQTRSAMREIETNYHYQADPHGAIAFLGLKKNGLENNYSNIFLETAHPCKFSEVVENATHKKVVLPEEMKTILGLEKKSIQLSNQYSEFKNFVMNL